MNHWLHRFASVALGVLVVAGSVGCSFHAFSPPTAAAMLETAETIKPEETVVSLEGGGGGFVFGRGAGYGSVRVRRSPTENLEGSVTVTGAYVDGGHFDCEPATDCRAGAARGFGVGGRAGVKWTPWQRHFALTGGLGLGGSTFGFHVGADVGAIVSYDNPYFVPLATLTFGVSLPVWGRELQFGSVRDRADPTLWLQPAVGFRVPIRPDGATVHGAILAGVGAVYLHDGTDGAGGGFASLAGEVIF